MWEPRNKLLFVESATSPPYLSSFNCKITCTRVGYEGNISHFFDFLDLGGPLLETSGTFGSIFL